MSIESYLNLAGQGLGAEIVANMFGIKEGGGQSYVASGGDPRYIGASLFLGGGNPNDLRDFSIYARGSMDTAWNYGGWSVPPYPRWGRGASGRAYAYERGYSDGRYDQAYADRYGSYFPNNSCCDDPVGRYGYRLPFNPMPANPWGGCF